MSERKKRYESLQREYDPGRFAAYLHEHGAAKFLEQFNHPFFYCLNFPTGNPKNIADEVASPELTSTGSDIEAIALSNVRLVPLKKVEGRNGFDQFICIGRARNNDIIIPDSTISTSHAWIKIERNPVSGALVYSIQDTGSTNGTYVERRLLEPTGWTRLQNQTTVSFSQIAFHYLEGKPIVDWLCDYEDMKKDIRSGGDTLPTE